MPPDMPPVPPAVVRFANEKQMTNLKQHIEWNYYQQNFGYFHGYRVYPVQRKDGKGKNMILYKDINYCLKTKPKNACKEDIRFATPDEIKEIIHVYL